MRTAMKGQRSHSHKAKTLSPWRPLVMAFLSVTGAGAQAQFTVTNSNGANNSYPTFATAITALTGASQAGFQPLLTLGADINEAITIPAHDWDSLFIRPSGQRHISATVSTIGGLVSFNGARNVTLDGIDADPTAPHRLVINNPSTHGNANAVLFMNGASHNKVTNCTLRGAAPTVAPADPGAVVGFWLSGPVGGNSHNTVSHCRIRNANTDPQVFDATSLLPARAIHSYVGSATAVLNDPARNSTGNRIEHNWISNFFLASPTAATSPSGGVLLSPGNHQWTIRGNRFFQEAPREFASGTGNRIHHIIGVDQTSIAGVTFPAGGHVVRDNVLGYAAADGTGTYDLHPAPATINGNVFRAIEVDIPNGAPRSTISGNTIDGIRHRSSASGASVAQFILINSGQVDADSNRVGNVDAPSATIELTSESPAPGITGISNVTGSDLRTRGNRIGGITVNRAGLTGIRNNGSGSWTCTGNEIGGASGLWTSAAQSSPVMAGLAAGRSVTAAIEDNTIRNLRISGNTSNNTPSLRGIEITSTSAGPHAVRGNRILDLTGEKPVASGDFTVTIYGVYSTRPTIVENNTIQGLVAEGGSSGTMTSTLRGIWTTGAGTHLTARHNTIGNFRVSFPNGAAAVGQVEGIRSEGNSAEVEVRGNRIGRFTIDGRTFVDATDGVNALAGIDIIGGTGAPTALVDSNLVYGLENTGTQNFRVYATGIRMASGGANTISRNVVHSIRASRGTSATALQSTPTGIHVVGGATNTVVNNMVRLGIDADGTPEDQGYRARGIWVAVPIAVPNPQVRLWHNSVYLGGVGTTPSAQSSHALLAQNNTVRDFRNNILWNARDIATSGAAAHHAMEVTHDTPHANLTSDFNCLRTTGTNGTRHLVRAGTTTYATLASWYADTGWDQNSFSTDPNFVNATGDTATVDLHIMLPSPIDATGVLLPQVTHDIDGEERALLTPVDIGADALMGTTSLDEPPIAAGVAGIQLWPNPATDHLFVEITSPVPWPYLIEIRDAAGRLVLTVSSAHARATIPLRRLEAGAYLLRTIDAGGTVTGLARFVKH